jgi:hypothetical protein
MQSPNSEKIGQPLANGSKQTSQEVVDSMWGTYNPVKSPAPLAKPDTSLDPKPFNALK